MSRSATLPSPLPRATVAPSIAHSLGSVIADWRARTAASLSELEQLLLDDVPHGDLTTEALGIGTAAAAMQFTARDRMVVALAEDAAALIELAGCEVDLPVRSGAA